METREALHKIYPSVLNSTIDDLKKNNKSILNNTAAFVALGELKGGLDPAGADEHWKTANSALGRIRKGFAKKENKPFTFFYWCRN